MDNFENAFLAGIEAARQVQYRRDEVQNILRKFSDSLEMATHGLLCVEVKKGGTGLSEFLGGFTTSAVVNPYGLYVSTKKEPKRSSQIAGWKQAADGYPCWITTSGQEIACLNSEGLGDELARLAASPRMGAAVLELMGPHLPDA